MRLLVLAIGVLMMLLAVVLIMLLCRDLCRGLRILMWAGRLLLLLLPLLWRLQCLILDGRPRLLFLGVHPVRSRTLCVQRRCHRYWAWLVCSGSVDATNALALVAAVARSPCPLFDRALCHGGIR